MANLDNTAELGVLSVACCPDLDPHGPPGLAQGCSHTRKVTRFCATPHSLGTSNHHEFMLSQIYRAAIWMGWHTVLRNDLT